ncbi:YhfC family glutamic-type intramembrane protease [Bacillus subtilis]|uniref:YhfC family glutamic-type intramembrane protease n=1 Tax=Bacillus subtilis TaxID=1423 RepID=UPI00254E8C9E|nr:YhfC family glutamic-type intramembrane protease [Bacillus subtilis]MDK7657945.1 YhfC family glutamic-type intramembrane protease [Bacillus subtilis]
MVSQEAVVFLALSGAIAFLLPIGLIVWFKRKYGASLKVFFIGALTFFVFAQLLEGGVHVYVQALLPIQEQLLHTPSYEWMLGGIERISAIAVQIGLSLLVLYAVKSRRPLFLLYSILLHALFNVPAVLYQRGIIEHAAAVEIIVALIAALSVYWIVKAKRVFQ